MITAGDFKNGLTFEMDGKEYRDICNGTLGCIYAELAELGKERKRLPHNVPDKYSEIIALAEKEMLK